MEYENRVGGRAPIFKILGDHLMKSTNEYELRSYLNLPRNIVDVAPQCCYIVSNGDVIPMRTCQSCNNPLALTAIETILDSHPDGNYLIMKDATHGMKKPRLIDLKLGTRTHSDFTTEEKKNNHILKGLRTTTSILGLRMCGASFFGNDDGDIVKWDKVSGKAWNGEEFVNAMNEFFDISKPQKSSLIIQLKKIKAAIETCPTFRFFGSSLLILIDDDKDDIVKVKLIDFQSMARSEHNTPKYEGVDNGAIFGVNNLLKILND